MPDIFICLRYDPMIRVFPIGMFPVKPWAYASGRIGPKWEKIKTVYRIRYRSPGRQEQSRHDVPKFYNCMADRTAFHVREDILSGGNEKRDPTTPFIWTGFAEHVVITKLLAVVGCKKDERIII